MFENEKIYIAGPECFYKNGYKIWNILKEKAEVPGFQVTLPNDMDFDFTPEDRRIIADEIFENCAHAMNESTAIIADLEAFRSSEPDCGTLYEIGMAFANGAKCYGYTRDKRSVTWKNQKGKMVNDIFLDEAGRTHPYSDLPFCPSLVGSTKIIEGDFNDCLKMFAIDVEEEIKTGMKSITLSMNSDNRLEQEKPVIYLSGPERYDRDAGKKYKRMKEICIKSGLVPITPIDGLNAENSDSSLHPYIWAANELNRFMVQVQKCDIILANLNDFRGWEPCNDTAFECGAAFQIGKKLYGYMDDTTRMIDRIPNFGKESEYKDECGNFVENFDYPINLMFSSSMKIFEGAFESIISEVVEDLKLNEIN
jgi:nucleoside 2-deoxyribosyltransferase